MSELPPDATDAVRELDGIITDDAPFAERAERALELGRQFLDVENVHVTRIEPEYRYWKSVLSTDPPDGRFPAGIILDLEDTYCNRTIEKGMYMIDQRDVRGDERNGLGTYLGIALGDADQLGTICFVSEEPREDTFSPAETMFAELLARRLEAELFRERTEDRMERLDQFTRTLSHDLRNPLSVAKGRLDLVQAEVESEHFPPIERSLERMESMIEEVLTWARETKEVDSLAQTHLSTVFEDAWQHVDTAEARYEPTGELTFYAARDRLERLLENLIRNAVEHGGKDVTVTVGPTDAGDGFFVADDGPGIPEEDRDRIFEAGYSTRAEGTGFGLSIVDAIATSHQWEIEVTESAAGGARFAFHDVIVDPAALPGG